MMRSVAAVLCALTACASADRTGAHGADSSGMANTGAAVTGTRSDASTATPLTSAAMPTSGTSTPSTPAKELPASDAYIVNRIHESPVDFFITGEKGRMAILASEQGAVVPQRLEAGKWERLPLPQKHGAASNDASLGIYFGRDNRPRLMGYRNLAQPKMVYLRFKDGAWQDQRSELGALAGDNAALFGVLGDADPEVVCRLDSICLLKSRKGWQEVERSIPPSAVVRAFNGVGYALTKDGLFRAGKKTFERVGGAAPWTTPATGFWVGEGPPAGDLAIVVEPEKNLLHVLAEPSGAWRTEPAPITRPRDVVGPLGFALVVGDGGIAHKTPKVGEPASLAGEWKRVGEPSWSFHRVIELPPSTFAIAGRSGVVTLTRR